jgi:hypothetical protein
MKIIIKPTGQGKTTELIKISAEKHFHIVCHSKKECERISNSAQSMKLDIPYPITFNEFLEANYYGKGIRKGFLIDNADMLLRSISRGVPIQAITLNQDNYNLDPQPNEN